MAPVGLGRSRNWGACRGACPRGLRAGVTLLGFSALLLLSLAGRPASSQLQLRRPPDFNRDGIADLAVGEDLAIGASGELPQPGLIGAGAVILIPGGPGNLQIALSEARYQISDREIQDRFGSSWQPATSMGYWGDDLAVGVPSEGVLRLDGTETESAGVVNVFYSSAGGGPTGLSISYRHFDQNTVGFADQPEENDFFGSALAAGDFNGDAQTDLAIGVPNEGLPFAYTGAAQVVFFIHDGTYFSQFWSQSSLGIYGVGEPNDRFGAAL
jgi:hypothetical protein